MTDYTSTDYTKNETELSWNIGPSAVCDENQTRLDNDVIDYIGVVHTKNEGE